jgi:hypothetical protein
MIIPKEMRFIREEQRESIAENFCVSMYEVELHELQVPEFVLNCYKFADNVLENLPYLRDMEAAYKRSMGAKEAAHNRKLNKMPYEPYAYLQRR